MPLDRDRRGFLEAEFGPVWLLDFRFDEGLLLDFFVCISLPFGDELTVDEEVASCGVEGPGVDGVC